MTSLGILIGKGTGDVWGSRLNGLSSYQERAGGLWSFPGREPVGGRLYGPSQIKGGGGVTDWVESSVRKALDTLI